MFKGLIIMMKLLVTAGGTGNAYHISSIVKEYYANDICLYITDIYDAPLVASSVFADHFIKVPAVNTPGYADYMYKLLKENDIDMIIPIIPWEQALFSPDNEAFAKLGIRSAAPKTALAGMLNNKRGLYEFCTKHDIPTIRIFDKSDIDNDTTYFIKPTDGFGAVNSRCALGNELMDMDFTDYVIQEYITGDEITVEVFTQGDILRTIARQRLESKCGVCTKARLLEIPEINDIIRRLTAEYEFPNVFNVQFINDNGTWKLMDVNLRLAAGTGLSRAAGFQLVRAYLAYSLGQKIDDSWFDVDYSIKTILRIYKEVVIR